MIAVSRACLVIEPTQAELLTVAERAAPGAGREIEAIAKMPLTTGELRRHHPVIMGLDRMDVGTHRFGQRRDPLRRHLTDSILAEIDLEMVGEQSQVVVVILE